MKWKSFEYYRKIKFPSVFWILLYCSRAQRKIKQRLSRYHFYLFCSKSIINFILCLYLVPHSLLGFSAIQPVFDRRISTGGSAVFHSPLRERSLTRGERRRETAFALSSSIEHIRPAAPRQRGTDWWRWRGKKHGRNVPGPISGARGHRICPRYRGY